MTDPLKKLKGFAYTRTFPNPEGVSLAQLIIIAKTSLCKLTNTLYKDPVWDLYTDEELLIEYFCHRLTTDEDFKEDVEVMYDIFDKTVNDWLADKVSDLDAELEAELDAMDDEISLDMDTIGA